MAICKPCQQGRHPHDRHTGRLPGSFAGQDAGCPNVVPSSGGYQCTCDVVLAPIGRSPKRHCPTCQCEAS